MKIRKKLLIAVGIATLSFGGSYLGVKTATEQVQSNNVDMVESVSKTDTEEFTEDRVYEMSELTDRFMKMPLKATIINKESQKYTMLSDGQGAFYILDEILIDGQNYIGTVDNNIGKIVDYTESHFIFTYEDYFTEYEVEELEVGIEMIEQMYISM